MDYNILILSAGRRVELVEHFKNARDQLRIKGNIVAVDISDLAPAIYFADKYYLIPRISDEKYLDSIIEICNKENISLIVPTIDTELLKLAENRHYIEEKTSSKILLSRTEVIKICRDKAQTQQFFEKNGFGVPRLYTKEDIEAKNYTFPLFIKPSDGSSSINTFKVKNEAELQFFLNYVDKPLVQEYIEGTEFSVDTFCDFDSKPISIVVRRRIATRSGEITKGEIVKDEALQSEILRMLEVLRPTGPVTIQCMRTKTGIKYIEINPRFGGGAPMSIAAGANLCEYLYRLLMGEKLEFQNHLLYGSKFLRFDKSIMIR